MGDTEQQQEVLVVASKVKAFVAAKANGMRTSAEVFDALTTIVANALSMGVAAAQKDKRSTLKARDLPSLLKSLDAVKALLTGEANG